MQWRVKDNNMSADLINSSGSSRDFDQGVRPEIDFADLVDQVPLEPPGMIPRIKSSQPEKKDTLMDVCQPGAY